jgi:hypothetical protein
MADNFVQMTHRVSIVHESPVLLETFPGYNILVAENNEDIDALEKLQEMRIRILP